VGRVENLNAWLLIGKLNAKYNEFNVKFQAFWHVILFHCASSFRPLEGPLYRHLQGQVDQVKLFSTIFWIEKI